MKRWTRREKTGNKEHNSGIRLAAATVFLVISAALMVISVQVPDFAEWYAETVYPLLVTSLGRMWGLLPFSVSEIGLYILFIVFCVSLVIMIAKLIRQGRGSVRERTVQIIICWLSKVLLAVGILAFLYTVCCGINYRRQSFSGEEGIVTYEYTAQELQEICRWLTDEVNALVHEVDRDKNGVMQPEAPEGAAAVEAMQNLGEKFPVLDGYYPQPKKLIVSEILSFQGLTGVYSPFTVEANYNGDMTAYNIPFTACHELSHLRGFMQEEEANFIAFLACVEADRTDFKYSGYLSGWIYCMNALYRTDYERWQEVRNVLDEGAEPDLEANSAFWDAYEGVISDTADKINDTYLKVNGQTDGVKSYDRMVDLIVAYFGK